jgi:SAM-dependent methyltransferase
MTPLQTFNEEQRARWNGVDGQYWAREQDKLDQMLAPVLTALLEFAEPAEGSTVLDIGCGCGVTTVELARMVGPRGKVVGLDVSEPMLEVAKARLAAFPQAECWLGDAMEVPVAGLEAELLVSRFGVMFFGDPVAAFRNLRTGLKTGGRVRFACWQAMAVNPWMQVPLEAVYRYVPRLPAAGPEDPGPYSFGDPARVTRILTAAGFSAPRFKGLDIQIDLAAGGAPGGFLEDAVEQVSHLGPPKRALLDQPVELREKAVGAIREALGAYVSADGVRLPGAIWLVEAEREG